MAERLREFGRFDLDLLDSSEYLEMPPATRNDAYLYMLALTGWSRKRLTDGVIPTHVTRDLAARMGYSATILLRVLSKVGIAQVETDHVFLLKFRKWQETREQVEGRRRSQNERQSRHRHTDVTRDGVEMSRVSHAVREEKRREEKEESREEQRVTVGFQKPRYDGRQLHRYVFKADGTVKGVGEPE